MRLFLAIELPESVKNHLTAARANCPFADQKLSWTKLQNLHITVKFLGEVDDARAHQLMNSLQSLPTTGPITAHSSAVQFFPTRGPIRIVAVNVTTDIDSVTRLYQHIETICMAHRFPRESRPFHPHITLARSRFGLNPSIRSREPSNWPPPSEPFPIDHISLMRSELLPEAPRHSVLARFNI
jgi:RNA 2',3'-cyclic 3'-phosphodiesterase